MKKVDKLNEYVYEDVPFITVVMPDITTDNKTCFVAYHPDLEGCMSHGETYEEAIENLKEARQLYISVLKERGISVSSLTERGISTSSAPTDVPVLKVTMNVSSQPKAVQQYSLISKQAASGQFSELQYTT